MIGGYPKRLIEVDLPIARISAHARREKSIRHGHISTLHIWWARRPLAACRAVILASLWPDPVDLTAWAREGDEVAAPRGCKPGQGIVVRPDRFLAEARQRMASWAQIGLGKVSAESGSRLVAIQKNPSLLDDPEQLRRVLLDFIADFADWDHSRDRDYLGTARQLVQAAHESLGGASGTQPLVADPFAGGGAIPLEALRVGADAYASDLNPVAVLLNKVVLEYIPKYGRRLPEAVDRWADLIQKEIEQQLGCFYPKTGDGLAKGVFIWARTILSEAPSEDGIPTEVPLLRSMLLLHKPGRYHALRWIRDKRGAVKTELASVSYSDGRTLKIRRPLVEVFQPKSLSEVEVGTSSGGAATCPVTGYTTSVESVRQQLTARRGGAEDARLICVVVSHSGSSRDRFRLPSDDDVSAVESAAQELRLRTQHDVGTLPLLPDGELNHLRGFFNVVLYGMKIWSDLFSSRQALGLSTLAGLIQTAAGDEEDPAFRIAIQTCLALALDRCADKCASVVVWDNTRDMATHVFGRQALPMVWDFAEVNLLEDNGWKGAAGWVVKVLERTASAGLHEGFAISASATKHPLPDDTVDAFVTDPPYYAAIPYADLSDFFYSWLKRSIGHLHRDLLGPKLSPKEEECVALSHRAAMYRNKDAAWFERTMMQACAEGRRITKPSGVGVFVFANKETEGWEAMLAALTSSGWTITGSWPIDTEMSNRLRAQNSAVLGSSVHLVCRPRKHVGEPPTEGRPGDWREVIRELPRRIHEWMPRLASEGIVGADAIFACLGPALEIFSRYSRVEKASGEEVALRDYLEQVWSAVASEALSMIFKDANASGMEPDARLTAIWLWTMGGGRPDSNGAGTDDGIVAGAEGGESDEREGSRKKTGASGFVLGFDAARKIAQGLGVHLEDCQSIVEIKGETARLLPVAERMKYLLGQGREVGSSDSRRRKEKPRQHSLFEGFEVEEVVASGGVGDVQEHKLGTTVLDRLHQAMVLFAAGRGDVLRRFVVAEGVGKDARFWRLADSLAALYPRGTDERRWVEGVLARKRGLGF